MRKNFDILFDVSIFSPDRFNKIIAMFDKKFCRIKIFIIQLVFLLVFFLLPTSARCSYVRRRSSSGVALKDSLRDLIYRWRWKEAKELLDDNEKIFGSLDDDFLRGYVNLKMKNFVAAESLFSNIVGEKYELGDWAIVFLAQAAYLAHHYDAAYNFSHLAGFVPAFKDTIVKIRWRSLFEAGKKEEALAELDSLYRKKFYGKWLYKLLRAKVLIDIGRRDEAERILREILKSLHSRRDFSWLVKVAADEFSSIASLSDKDYKLLGLSYYFAREYGDAVKYLGKYSKTDDIPSLSYYLATSYLKIGVYKTALIRYDNLLQDSKYTRSSLWWRKAYCYRKTKKFKLARESIDSAVAQCKNCGNRLYILKEKLFLAQDTDDLHLFAHTGAEIAAADPSGNTGSAGLIWAITGYLALGFPDSAKLYAELLKGRFNDKNFLDEVLFWERDADLQLGDTASADTILSFLAKSFRKHIFTWLSAKEKFSLELPSPFEFKKIPQYDADSIYRSAKMELEKIVGGKFDKNPDFLKDEFFKKANHLAELGLVWLARPCFVELGKSGKIGKSAKEDIELWRYYYSAGLYDLAKISAERIRSRMKAERNRYNPKIMRLEYILPFEKTVLERCRQENIDPLFLYAVMFQESKYNPHAVSPANAMGLMQFIEKTGSNVAKWLNITDFQKKHLFDYKISISLSARLLSYLLNQRMSPYFALAEYNGGDKRTDRWMEKCPDRKSDIFCTEFIDSKETRLYVKKIMGYYYTYHWLYGGFKNGK